jgi:predicted TIM-barrel fold metal-dependent hydrolase
MKAFDCNVSFGHWPFARVAEDTPARLDALLAREGISRALVSSADAVLYEEPEECNRWLVSRLKKLPRLVPVPVVNPRVRSAQAIVDRPDLVAVKLIPNFHVYSLRDPRALALCRLLARRRVPVLVQMRMEDERGQHELFRVPGVDGDDIAALATAIPGLTIVALCPYFAEALRLAAVPNIHVDISFVENLDTLGQLCAKIPAGKVLFGSHSPWLYPKAAVAKLTLSRIGAEERKAIARGNAARIFG